MCVTLRAQARARRTDGRLSVCVVIGVARRPASGRVWSGRPSGAGELAEPLVDPGASLARGADQVRDGDPAPRPPQPSPRKVTPPTELADMEDPELAAAELAPSGAVPMPRPQAAVVGGLVDLWVRARIRHSTQPRHCRTA